MDDYYLSVNISLRDLLEHLYTKRNEAYDLIDKYDKKENESLKNHDHGSAAEYRQKCYMCMHDLRRINTAINSICSTIDEMERESRRRHP